MVEVTWAEPAFEDLRQVHTYIARDSRRYADVTVRKIRSAAESLAAFPERGRVVPEFPDGPYRELLSGNYRILYRRRTDADSLLIVAVIHASRLLPPILESRGEASPGSKTP